MDKEFTDKMKELEAANGIAEKTLVLEHIASFFKLEKTSPLLIVVQHSNLIRILSQVMAETKQWASKIPMCINILLATIYRRMHWNIPNDQTCDLINTLQEYLMLCESESTVVLLGFIANPKKNKELLLANTELYNILKKMCLQVSHLDLRLKSLRFFQLVSYNREWKLKLLNDKAFILALLSSSVDDTWVLLSNISSHPDSKLLFPPEVAQMASKTENAYSTTICAALCNEADAASLKVDTTFIGDRTQELNSVLALKYDIGKKCPYSFLSAIFPFVNLSIADANKDIIGQHLVAPLMEVLAITREKPLIPKIDDSLEEAKQFASKVLWNLAFTEVNRTRIANADGGLAFLRSLLTTDDEVLKQNIEGILYMFSRQNVEPALPHETPKGGHVMISYCWANQPTVLRLAESLKARGYKIWIDVEQMQGSTLETMAQAIEGAESVLMCASQKYKDSPNCRLEGEYCVNRKVNYIPLLMQKDYKADGWLGIAMGSKMYYSFTTEDDWDQTINALVKALGKSGHTTALSATTTQPAAQSTKLRSPETWTNEELFSWMQAQGISHHYDLFIKHEMDGNSLLELKQTATNMPIVIRKILGITSLGQILKITSAIRKL